MRHQGTQARRHEGTQVCSGRALYRPTSCPSLPLGLRYVGRGGPTLRDGRLGRAAQDGRRGGRPLRDGRYRARPLRAFTLVELLVVIVIIGILVGLLVPAVARVRRIGKETACKAVIESISTGLETYKANEKLGGSYPPSFSDADGSGGSLARGLVKSPYINSGNIAISGAGLLLWALSGADLLGTSGFQPMGGVATWAPSTGRTTNTNPALADAYAVDTNTQQPQHTRYGPFVEGSKLKVSRNINAAAATPDFAVPGETEARKALGLSLLARYYPMYLDAFGYPVLYWRADLAGRALADVDRMNPTTVGRGVYHWEDNKALVDSQGGSPDVLTLNKSGEPHVLGWNGSTYTGGSGTIASPPPLGTFEGYIRDQGVQAKLWPQRADSYLLVSPGYDGLYGTADDITNFQQNGQ